MHIENFKPGGQFLVTEGTVVADTFFGQLLHCKPIFETLNLIF